MRWQEIGDIILRKEEFSDAGKAQVLIEASDADGGRRDFLYEEFLPEFVTALSGIFREEGIPDAEVVEGTKRPLFMEVPLAVFAGAGGGR